MATLYVRARTLPNGERRFDVKYRRGGRYTHLEHGGTFRTRKEATIRRDRIGEWLAAGLNPRAELRRIVQPSRTVSDVQAEWLAGKRRIGDTTMKGYVVRARRIDKEIGRLHLDELTVEEVISWVGDLVDSGLAPTTVRGYLGQLRMALDVLDGPNVARSRRVELPRIVTAERDPPDADEVLALLASLDKTVLGPVLTMEQLGTRVGETLTLEPRDLQDGGVRVRREASKGQRTSRLVPASPLLIDVLTERLPFKTTRITVWRHMTKHTPIHPHLLRHRRGSLWHQQGIVAVELARRLGHAKASTSLDIYSHARPLSEIADHDLASLLR